MKCKHGIEYLQCEECSGLESIEVLYKTRIYSDDEREKIKQEKEKNEKRFHI